MSEVQLGAAGAEGHTWQGVTERLEANFLAIWPENEKPLLLVSFDLLYVGRRLRAAVERAASSIPPERIFVCASHTHRAPMTDDTKPLLGKPDRMYLEALEARLGDTISALLRDGPGDEVHIAVGQSVAAHSINRRRRKRFFIARRPRFNEVLNAPNPKGTVDEVVHSVQFIDRLGRPMALLWNYACHPVGFPILNTVAAHFPSVARAKVRASTKRDIPVLFFQGFSGNTRPRASATVHSIRRRIRRVVSGPLFEDMTWKSYRLWSNSLADVLLASMENAVNLASPAIEAKRVSISGPEFAQGLKAPVTFQGIHFGRDISIIGVSGEVVAEYASIVRELSSATYTLCVGCIDHAFGYVPTTRILREGGYEAGGYCNSFGIGKLNENLQESVLRGISEVLP